MHRARFAEEAGAELLEYAIGVDEDLKKTPHCAGIVGRVPIILREPDRVRQFVWYLVDDDLDSDVGEIGHHGRVEARDRLPGQSKLAREAVAGRDPQRMVDEVEVDLEVARAVRDRRGRQSSRGDIERYMPGVIEPGRAHESNLAGDLAPQVQRLIGFPPRCGWQFRPVGWRGAAHA